MRVSLEAGQHDTLSTNYILQNSFPQTTLSKMLPDILGHKLIKSSCFEFYQKLSSRVIMCFLTLTITSSGHNGHFTLSDIRNVVLIIYSQNGNSDKRAYSPIMAVLDIPSP